MSIWVKVLIAFYVLGFVWFIFEIYNAPSYDENGNLVEEGVFSRFKKKLLEKKNNN